LCASDSRIFAGDETHALQLGQHDLALENTLPVDVYAPFALGLASIGGVLGTRVCDLQCRFGLVKVPVQRRPQHHGDLAGWRRSRLELAAAGIRYGRDVEVVSIQGGLLEAVYATWWEQLLLILLLLLLFVRGQFILGVEHNSPARRKWRMRVDIARLEEEASKDRRDGKVLAVGQVNNINGRHDDVGGVAKVSCKKEA
jgi:hypothetical protein